MSDSTVLLWPDPVAGPWRVELTFAVVAGREDCVGLSIQSHHNDPDDELTATIMRRLPVGALVALAMKQRRPPQREQARSTSLVEVAKVYEDAWRGHLPPTRAVADAFNLSQSAAAKRVFRAREAGLLPPARPGRAGAR